MSSPITFGTLRQTVMMYYRTKKRNKCRNPRLIVQRKRMAEAMIIRIYRVQINPGYREEFEKKFSEVAEQFVAGREGLVSLTIGKPTQFAPDTYVMISNWKDVDSVKSFAGPNWGEPIIPEHMKRYTINCWLDQFEAF